MAEEVQEYIDHNEFEVALVLLADRADERGGASVAFWNAAAQAAKSMGARKWATTYSTLRWGAEHGYLEAEVTVNQVRKQPIFTGYRAAWRVDQVERDLLEVHDAPLLLMYRDRIEPGDSGRARLFPVRPELWPVLEPGDEITMHEGVREVGSARIIAVHPPASDAEPA